LVIGYWLLVIGYWLLVIGYWLLVIGYWLGGAVTCWLFALDEHIKVARYLALDSGGGTGGIDNIIRTLAGGLGSVVAISHG
jgi:hypothetical protein